MLVFRRKIAISTVTFLLVLSGAGLASSPKFSNYTTAITVNDVIQVETLIYAATNGGLMVLDLDGKAVGFLQDNTYFRDPRLTALSNGAAGLWVGSKGGFLYNLQPSGNVRTVEIYLSKSWDIRALSQYREFLLVGSSMGLGVFDTKHGVSRGNAFQFGGFSNNSVNDIAVRTYTDDGEAKVELVIALNDGIARLDISGDGLRKKNFGDPSIWDTQSASDPVVSLISRNDSILTYSNPTTILDGRLVSVEGATVMDGSSKVAKSPSPVLSLLGDTRGNLWVGTEADYLYRWNGNGTEQFRANSITFRQVNRIVAAEEGVWCVPTNRYPHPWWFGVSVLSSDTWTNFTTNDHPALVSFGGASGRFGMLVDDAGWAWVGSLGGGLKRFQPDDSVWQVYRVGGHDVNVFELKELDPDAPVIGWWGRTEAIAKDSSGYIWFSRLNGFKGSLVCYDPSSGEYANICAANTECYTLAPSAMAVGKSGALFMGSHSNWGVPPELETRVNDPHSGYFIVVRHNGDPINHGVQTVYRKSDIGTVRDIEPLSEGNAIVATTKGIYRYSNIADKHFLELIHGSPANAQAVKSEGDSTLWIGLSNEGGLVRYHPVSDTFRTADTRTYGTDHGLVSSTINDLDIDRSTGMLWIAGDEGVSSHFLGHAFDPPDSSSGIVAYPNPYSVSRESRISFYRVPNDQSVSIYQLNGKLVTSIQPFGSNTTKTPYHSTIHWEPGDEIAPGTYFYVTSGDTKQLFTFQQSPVGKLLVIP